MQGFDPKDLVIRTLWTAVAASLGYVLTEIADWGQAWVPFATTVVTLVLVWVRQQVPPISAPPDDGT